MVMDSKNKIFSGIIIRKLSIAKYLWPSLSARVKLYSAQNSKKNIFYPWLNFTPHRIPKKIFFTPWLNFTPHALNFIAGLAKKLGKSTIGSIYQRSFSIKYILKFVCTKILSIIFRKVNKTLKTKKKY